MVSDLIIAVAINNWYVRNVQPHPDCGCPHPYSCHFRNTLNSLMYVDVSLRNYLLTQALVPIQSIIVD